MCVLVKIFEGIRWILDQKRALQLRIYAYSESYFQFIFKTFSKNPDSPNVNIFFQYLLMTLNNYQLIFNILAIGSQSCNISAGWKNT